MVAVGFEGSWGSWVMLCEILRSEGHLSPRNAGIFCRALQRKKHMHPTMLLGLEQCLATWVQALRAHAFILELEVCKTMAKG